MFSIDSLQVEVASLMAAHAAEQAAANIKSAAAGALADGSVKAAEVEKIVRYFFLSSINGFNLD